MSKPNQIQCTCLNCGKIFSRSQGSINQGRGKFCSKTCSGKVNSFHHGHTTHTSSSPTYNTWTNMISRCHREYAARYKDYGAKGVSVCARWRSSFQNFLEDMGVRPDGHTIDRIDSTGNYSPENCRWATIKEQQRNRKNNINLTIGGVTMCLKDWATKAGISENTLTYRVHIGWPVEKWLSPPSRTL